MYMLCHLILWIHHDQHALQYHPQLPRNQAVYVMSTCKMQHNFHKSISAFISSEKKVLKFIKYILSVNLKNSQRMPTTANFHNFISRF